ncbi:DGQHR domain-containing protein [Bordetella sp. 15P40C-2]|uniref:DGQHR domain-containing protein n=1 Tax=Bordetella sp. 15P40C-2 TaxID=2572246 RepID=UPI001327DFBD|nr:DGQHR domain-containing protein [Bordetella sp. 15P40C-2]MVW72158.1 DGQHR domain-containing protein [Bordetella sp. 15P40C-2]
MAKAKKTADVDEDVTSEPGESHLSFAARLITQGQYRFYSVTMPSDVLGATCTVETRYSNPVEGFQRALDEKRAQEIADYIDSGFGTIPCSIILSAQPSADLKYFSRSQVLRINPVPGAFLILDGQHRVYGFHKAKTNLRVPVVIYNGLSRSDEARLFIDINTKQRPVPNELLLDIKKLADAETGSDALHREVYDMFHERPESPLLGLMSPSSRSKGKISRVTFKAALNSISRTIGDADSDWVYSVLRPYIAIWASEIRSHAPENQIANSTLFRAILLFFPLVAERVHARHGDDYSAQNFSEVLTPFFARLRKSDICDPGQSPVALFERYEQVLKTGFTLGGPKKRG